MSSIKITCDSTCDLPRELYALHGVEVISLGVSMGDDFRHDGVNVTADELYDYVSKSGQLPKTSAVSMGEYQTVFEKYTAAGAEVVHINLSSDLSASHQNALIAAQEVEGVYPVDSRNLSTGSGHLVLLAAQLAKTGMGAAEIARELEAAAGRVDASFVLQTLEYLHKGGRCSGIAAFGANLLNLRPEIEVKNGKLGVAKKYRGSAEKSILAYVRGRLEGRTDIDHSRIFITHSGVPREILDKVHALVKELQPFEEVIETIAGSTISCHCGPCCLGVLFLRSNES